MKNRLTKICAAVVMLACTVFAPMIQVSAATSTKDSILNKSYARQLQQCYTENQVFNPNATIRNNAGNSDMIHLLLSNTGVTVAVNNEQASKGNATRVLPSGMTANDNASCRTLIEQALDRLDVNIPDKTASLEEKKKFFESFGYSCPGTSSANSKGEITCRLSGDNDGNNKSNALTAIKNLFGYAKEADMQLTDEEKIVMYQSYLEGVADAEIACGSKDIKTLESKEEAYEGQYKYETITAVDKNGKVRDDCEVRIRADKYDQLVNGLDEGGYFGDQVKMSDVIKELQKNYDIDELSEEETEAIQEIADNSSGYDARTGLNTNNGAYDGSGTNTAKSSGGGSGSSGSSEEGEEDPCFGQSGAMGWFVCPVMNALGSVLAKAYQNWIEPLLRVNDGTIDAFGGDGKNGIFAAWGIFRDVANIVFVIMLLVIIFSQVTGYGIDNYGIKRMLPRLIVTAIIVNFSFIICQLAVDISDLVGASIQSFLTKIANDNVMLQGDMPNLEGGDQNAGSFIGAIVKTLVIGGAAAFAAYEVVGFGFIMPALAAILSGVIGIFFGFVLLGARQALIIIFIVISPVALVLNMLPNTSNLFNKWRSIFVNLLMVYPAAGLLIGGSYLAARVILSTKPDNFFLELVALLLLVIPYFGIIPLVKGAISTIGNIGGRIASFGNTVQSRATGAFKGSEGYRAMNTKSRNFDPGGLRTKVANSRIGSKVPGLQTSRARQIMAAQKIEDEERQAQILSNQEQYGWRSNDQLTSDLERALDKNRGVDVALGGFAAADRKEAAKAVSKIVTGLDVAHNPDDVKKMEALQRYVANDSNFAGQLKSVDKGALEFLNKRGNMTMGENGPEYTNLVDGLDPSVGAYGQGMNDNDRLKQSAFAMERDMRAGSFSVDQVNSMLNSTDPEIQREILSDPGKQQLLQEFSDHIASGKSAAEFRVRGAEDGAGGGGSVRNPAPNGNGNGNGGPTNNGGGPAPNNANGNGNNKDNKADSKQSGGYGQYGSHGNADTAARRSAGKQQQAGADGGRFNNNNTRIDTNQVNEDFLNQKAANDGNPRDITTSDVQVGGIDNDAFLEYNNAGGFNVNAGNGSAAGETLNVRQSGGDNGGGSNSGRADRYPDRPIADSSNSNGGAPTAGENPPTPPTPPVV